MYNLLFFKKDFLYKTNPYKSIEQYKIYFKKPVLGVESFDDFELLIDSKFSEDLMNIFEEKQSSELNFIINDLFNWNGFFCNYANIKKLGFVDPQISTPILSILLNLESKNKITENTIFFDLNFLHIHSNHLFFSNLNDYYFMYLFNQLIKHNVTKLNIIAKFFQFDFEKDSIIIYIANLNKFCSVKKHRLFSILFKTFLSQKIITNSYSNLDALPIFNFNTIFFSNINKKILKKTKKVTKTYWYYYKKVLLFKNYKNNNIKNSKFNTSLNTNDNSNILLNVKPLLWLYSKLNQSFYNKLKKNINYLFIFKVKNYQKKDYKIHKLRHTLAKKSLKRSLKKCEMDINNMMYRKYFLMNKKYQKKNKFYTMHFLLTNYFQKISVINENRPLRPEIPETLRKYIELKKITLNEYKIKDKSHNKITLKNYLSKIDETETLHDPSFGININDEDLFLMEKSLRNAPETNFDMINFNKFSELKVKLKKFSKKKIYFYYQILKLKKNYI